MCASAPGQLVSRVEMDICKGSKNAKDWQQNQTDSHWLVKKWAIVKNK